MATITQDMRYRLSLIRFADKYGVTEVALNIKQTGSTFTAGNALLMARSSPFGIVL